MKLSRGHVAAFVWHLTLLVGCLFECSCLLLVSAPRRWMMIRRQGIRRHGTPAGVALPLPLLEVSLHNATQQYATNHNITYHSNLFDYVGVRPFVVFRNRPWPLRQFPLWTWKTRGLVLAALHAWDPLKPSQNSCINLECLWYKAMATNDRRSPLYDDGLSNDLLPAVSRLAVHGRLCRWYPRLVHGRLEVRAAYIQHVIQQEVVRIRRGNNHRATKIRLVSLGAGYDLRSLHLRQQGLVDASVEFDLPIVVQNKRRLLRQRLCRRRPNLSEKYLPTLHGVDLNQVGEFRQALSSVLASDRDDKVNDWHTIFVTEGVLMYVKQSRQILQTCADCASSSSSSLSSSLSSCTLLFADRLGNVTDVDLAACDQELRQSSWRLTEWAPMPNMNAKHIGMARPL